MEKLKRYDLNCNIFDVYSYDGLSMQELLCQFYTKINECVDFSNSTLDLCEWLVNEGLKQEVAIKLTNWLNDGTLENLINVTLFENLNKKIDNVSSQLAHNMKVRVNVALLGLFSDTGEDVSEKIQSIIDDNNRLYFPKGKYIISKPIMLHSDIDILFDDNCEIFLKDLSRCIMFDTNSAIKYKNITIAGGIINGNDYGQGVQSGEGLFNFSNAFRFYNVDNLRVENITITDVRGHCIQHWNCNYVDFENIKFFQNYDNINRPYGGSRRDGITGGSSNDTFKNISGFTDDDMIAILSGVEWGGVQVGNIENIFIENVNCNEKSNPQMNRNQPTRSAIRIACANGYATKNVYIKKVTGNFAVSPIRLGGYDDYTKGNLSNINIDNINNINISNLGDFYDERGLIMIEKCKCDKLTIKNCDILTNYEFKGTLLFSQNCSVDSLLLENIKYNHNNTGSNLDKSTLIKDRADSLSIESTPFIKKLYFNNVNYNANHEMLFYRRQAVRIDESSLPVTHIYGQNLIYNEDVCLDTTSTRISINSYDININSYSLLLNQKNNYKWSYNNHKQFINNDEWFCLNKSKINVNDYYNFTSRDSLLLVTPKSNVNIRIKENQNDKFPVGFSLKIRRVDKDDNLKAPYLRMTSDCILTENKTEVYIEINKTYTLTYLGNSKWILDI